MRPLLSIWIKPRKTFEFLEKREEVRNTNAVNTLIFFGTMTAGFSNANDIIKVLEINPYIGLLIAMIFSGLLGLLLFHFVATPIILLTSKLFQGKAKFKEIKLTIAYSQVPNLVHLIIGVIVIVLSLISGNSEILIFGNNFTFYVLLLFSFSIVIYGLAYFNKYSYGYALLTLLIPIALFQGIIYLVRFIIT
jgi:hypothetical protein